MSIPARNGPTCPEIRPIVSGYVNDGIIDMVSSPARKLDAAIARFVLRGVFPKKDIAGGLDPPEAAPVAMVTSLVVCRFES